MRSPAESTRGRSPVLEPLRHLITNLGPPPLAVTWNRPQISANPPPVYSRFQDFMLRNAFRSTESFLTARAVYDGGESKVCMASCRFQRELPCILPRLADHRIPIGWALRHLYYPAQCRRRID